MIRSIGLLVILLGSVPFILIKPHMGVLMWSWISYMNPHRLAFGFIYDFPVADVIAGATLVGWVISREPKKIPMHPLTVLLLTYAAWVSMTTIFAVDDTAFDKWLQTMKILLFTLVTMGLMGSYNRLHSLIWIIILCLGYFALKGGAFTLLTGGGMHVYGPAHSFIADNNALALALVMTFPIVRYLHGRTDHWFLKLGLTGGMLLWILAILGSQSRGAFVAVTCMLFFLWLKSRYRLFTGVMILFALVIGFSFMPERWMSRMESITEYQQDESFMGRVTMWDFAIRVANDNPMLGGGFRVFYSPVYHRIYLDPSEEPRDVHNIYFETLGEHGYMGLAIFLIIGITAFFTCSRIIRLTRHRPELLWAHELAPMLQVALVGYAVNGMTLNLATFDLYYLFLSVIVLLRKCVAEALEETGARPQFGARGQFLPTPASSSDAPALRR